VAGGVLREHRRKEWPANGIEERCLHAVGDHDVHGIAERPRPANVELGFWQEDKVPVWQKDAVPVVQQLLSATDLPVAILLEVAADLRVDPHTEDGRGGDRVLLAAVGGDGVEVLDSDGVTNPRTYLADTQIVVRRAYEAPAGGGWKRSGGKCQPQDPLGRHRARSVPFPPPPGSLGEVAGPRHQTTRVPTPRPGTPRHREDRRTVSTAFVTGSRSGVSPMDYLPTWNTTTGWGSREPIRLDLNSPSLQRRLGAGDEARTRDPYLGKVVLYH
jgi:hypothetical protein